MKPEEEVENHLRKRVLALGGMCIKMLPTITGVPDRLVLLPPGSVHLAELKQAKGRLRPRQVVFRDRAAKIGVEVAVLHTKEAVDEWLASVASHRVE